MRKLVLGFLLIATSVAGQELDKSIAILVGPTDMWTKNRLTTKDEYNSFNHIGLQLLDKNRRILPSPSLL
jgi:hypothetical protein